MADDKNTRIIDGFAFSDDAIIEMALKEENAVNYLQGQIDYNKPETVLSVYQKLVHQKVFRTAVGTSFLHDLQRYLRSKSQIPETLIDPIYADPMIPDGSRIESADHRQTRRENARERDNYRDKFRASVVFGVIMTVAVIAMVVIGMTSNMTTIVNYKQKLEDEYATWQQELDQREKQIRARENELMMQDERQDNTFGENTGS